MRALNLIWPTDPNPSPGGVARLGRVLHWLAAAIALGFTVGSINMGRSANPYDHQTALAMLAFGGGGFLIFGRAVRYILAGE